MAIITLTTDMGTRDHYVAAIKGAILSLWEQAVIVDISHHVAPFNNMHAAFVLRNAWREFPAGTVHVIGVNPEGGKQTPHVAVKAQGQYFIGADNGIFSLLFDGPVEAIHELQGGPDASGPSFVVKQVFVKAACHLARGGAPGQLGPERTSVNEQYNVRPAVTGDAIRGQVIHVDHYGNVITNITRELFDSMVGDRAFTLSIGHPSNNIRKIHRTYGDVIPGERVAFFGDSGHLEIAINKGAVGNGGGASQLLGLHVNDVVRLEFEKVPAQA